MPAVERRRGTEDFLLARLLQSEVERRRRVAVEHIGAGRVDIGEIRSQRPALPVDEPVRGDRQIENAGDGSDQDRGRDEPDALAREPGSAPQYLAHPVHCGSLLGSQSPALGQRSLNGELSRIDLSAPLPVRHRRFTKHALKSGHFGDQHGLSR